MLNRHGDAKLWNEVRFSSLGHTHIYLLQQPIHWKKALKLPLSSRCFLQYCGRVGCGVNLKLQSIICPWQWRFIWVLPIFLSCRHLCFIFVLLLFQDILQCRCFTTYVNVVRVTDVGTLNCKTKCAISLRTQHYYFSNPFMQKGSRSFL